MFMQCGYNIGAVYRAVFSHTTTNPSPSRSGSSYPTFSSLKRVIISSPHPTGSSPPPATEAVTPSRNRIAPYYDWHERRRTPHVKLQFGILYRSRGGTK